MCGRGLDSGWDADQWLCVLRSGKMNCQKVLGGGGVLFFFFFFFFYFFFGGYFGWTSETAVVLIQTKI